MKLKQLQQLITEVQEKMPCEKCRANYSEPEITIIGAVESEVHLEMKCRKCGHQSAMSATLDKYAGTRKQRGLIVRSMDKPLSDSVTPDDVIEMHNFLQDFTGNFHEIL
ncbi:MAG: hypothetical protein ABII07_01980 [Patescibacteria group bacterium]|nr:hypothetical protein [Patescibacteria group bacterium]